MKRIKNFSDEETRDEYLIENSALIIDNYFTHYIKNNQAIYNGTVDLELGGDFKVEYLNGLGRPEYLEEFSCKLVLDDDHGLINNSVQVLMDGVDITSSVYDQSTLIINIPKVTGPLVINANFSPIIKFEDDNVKALCVSNWGGHSVPGEMTEYEASQVTSLNGVFRKNTTIKKFNEFRFFTGLTELTCDSSNTAWGEFYNCTGLTDVTVPQLNWDYPAHNIKGIFCNCGNLKYVDLSPIKATSYGLHYVIRYPSDRTVLQEITLPGGYYGYNSAQWAFAYQKGLRTIRIGGDGIANFSGIIAYNSWTVNCTSLANIEGIITGIAANLTFRYSPLTRESALVILNGLSQLSTSKTVTFSYYTYNLLTDEDLAIATSKNWKVETIIEFGDVNVKSILLENFSDKLGLTYAGEITNLEAATITNFNSAFRENTTITSFDELRFFTGINTLRIEGSTASNSRGDFYGCTNLTSAKLPPINLTTYRIDAAFRTTSITELDLRPFGDTKVNIQSVLTTNTAVTKVYLPKVVNTPLTWAFRGCSALTTLDATEGSDWTAVARYSDFLTGCTSLTTIAGTITGIGSSVSSSAADGYSPSFADCPLTRESALVIINGLATITTGRSITFSTTTLSYLKSEDLLAIRAKGWSIAGNIVFEDNNVKAICVSNWGTGGELSIEQAATITDLGGVFVNNTDIVSFNELKYFTGLTSLYSEEATSSAGVTSGEFFGCTNLEYVTIPAAPLESLAGAFRECQSLKYVDLSPATISTASISRVVQILTTTSSLTYIKLPSLTCSGNLYYMFARRAGLETIEIDGTLDLTEVTSFESSFYSCSSLTNIRGTIVGISRSIDVSASPNLTRESLLVLINGLADLTGNTSKTLLLSYDAFDRLTLADLNIARNKNWIVKTNIKFKDSTVKDILLTNFPDKLGLEGDGKISNLELETITSLNGIFRENTEITSFNEFRHFTGITSFTHPSDNDAQGEFYGCTALEELRLPPITMTDADLQGLVRFCSKLKKLDLTPITATRYHLYYFAYMNDSPSSELTEIILPGGSYGGGSGNFNLSRYAFRFCKSLFRIKINGVADFSGVTSYQESAVSTAMFYQCAALTYIEGTITGISNDLYLRQSPLTRESALVIINGLATITGSTRKKLILSDITYNSLSSSDISIATDKFWTVSTS